MSKEKNYWDNSYFRYKGERKDDKPHGKGILYHRVCGGKIRYKGEFKNGQFHGYGLLYRLFSDKPKYKGMWKNGNRHGYGASYSYDGNLEYEGVWVEGSCTEEAPKKENTIINLNRLNNVLKENENFRKELEKLQKYILYAQRNMDTFLVDREGVFVDATKGHPFTPSLSNLDKITLERKEYQKLLIKEKFYNDVVYGTILK